MAKDARYRNEAHMEISEKSPINNSIDCWLLHVSQMNLSCGTEVNHRALEKAKWAQESLEEDL